MATTNQYEVKITLTDGSEHRIKKMDGREVAFLREQLNEKKCSMDWRLTNVEPEKIKWSKALLPPEGWKAFDLDKALEEYGADAFAYIFGVDPASLKPTTAAHAIRHQMGGGLTLSPTGNLEWNADGLIKLRETKEVLNMGRSRSLYDVYIVDPEGNGTIVKRFDDIIASDVDNAKLKAVAQLNDGDLDKDLEDYDILVEEKSDYGSIRAK